MLYQITFKGTETKVGEDPTPVRKVAYVEGKSTTEASANLIDAMSKDKTAGIRVDSIESISKASVSEVHFDDTKESIFYRIRIGYRDTADKRFKFTYIIIQHDSLLGAISKAEEIGKDNPAAAFMVYSGTITENLVLKSLVGDYAI